MAKRLEHRSLSIHPLANSPTSPNEDRPAMSHRRTRLLTILAASLALPLASLSLSLADVATLTADATTKAAAGGLVRGTVTSESPTKVEVKLGTTVTAIPTSEVVSITYDGHPASLDQAQAKESA